MGNNPLIDFADIVVSASENEGFSSSNDAEAETPLRVPPRRPIINNGANNLAPSKNLSALFEALPSTSQEENETLLQITESYISEISKKFFTSNDYANLLKKLSIDRIMRNINTTSISDLFSLGNRQTPEPQNISTQQQNQQQSSLNLQPQQELPPVQQRAVFEINHTQSNHRTINSELIQRNTSSSQQSPSTSVRIRQSERSTFDLNSGIAAQQPQLSLSASALQPAQVAQALQAVHANSLQHAAARASNFLQQTSEVEPTSSHSLRTPLAVLPSSHNPLASAFRPTVPSQTAQNAFYNAVLQPAIALELNTIIQNDPLIQAIEAIKEFYENPMEALQAAQAQLQQTMEHIKPHGPNPHSISNHRVLGTDRFYQHSNSHYNSQQDDESSIIDVEGLGSEMETSPPRTPPPVRRNGKSKASKSKKIQLKAIYQRIQNLQNEFSSELEDNMPELHTTTQKRMTRSSNVHKESYCFLAKTKGYPRGKHVPSEEPKVKTNEKRSVGRPHKAPRGRYAIEKREHMRRLGIRLPEVIRKKQNPKRNLYTAVEVSATSKRCAANLRRARKCKK